MKNPNTRKLLFEEICLFLFGAVVYMLIEILYRGYTHWTMGVVGGFCFVLIGLLNEQLTYDIPVIQQMVLGSLTITSAEFISGVILNIILGLHIWDYSDVPFNVFGQICLPFSIAWLLLSFVAMLLDDYLRWKVFGEEKPHYNWEWKFIRFN